MSAGLPGAYGVSPLHDYWAARSLVNTWGPAEGLTIPGVISSTDGEVAALGSAAAFADISYRTLLSISGSDTAAFLAVLSGDAEDVFGPGRTRAIVWCDADGFARGAGQAAMRAPDMAVLVSQISDLAWLKKAASPFGVQIEKSAAAGVRLAGPMTQAILQACSAVPGPACELVFPGLGPVLAIAPKADALDLWVEPDNAQALAWVLEGAGAVPAGAHALNAWRMSNGLLAAGSDWTPVQHATARSAFRTREHLASGGYALGAWNTQPPAGVENAVHWRPLGQWMAILWLPPQPGRAQSAAGGGTILGPAATD